MRSRPWPILILAVFHFISPVVNSLFSAQIGDISLVKFVTWQFANSSGFELFMNYLAFPVAGIALLSFKKWSYFLYLSMLVLVTVHNFNQWKENQFLYDPSQVMLFFLVNSIIFSYFLTPSVRKVYFYNRMRWWENETRFLVDFSAEVHLYNSIKPAIVRNLSFGGAQVEVEQGLSLGNLIELKFTQYDQSFSLKAEVLNQRGLLYGIAFEHSENSENDLKEFIYAYLAPKHSERDLRVPLIESFLLWFNRLIRTGEGIFPNQDTLNELKRKSLKKKVISRFSGKKRKNTRKVH